MSEYTAEEYCEVLRVIYNMNSVERETVFGVNGTTLDYILYHSAQEIIEMYRAYVNTPKVGEYWKRKTNGETVVVRCVKNNVVFVYLCDGGNTDCFSHESFIDNFTKTERMSRYLGLLFEEMKEASNEQDKNRVIH